MKVVVCFLLLFFCLVSHAVQHEKSKEISERDMTYTPEVMLSFNVIETINNDYPVLEPYADEISHWSAYYTINPKIVLSIIEYHSGALTSPEDANDIKVKGFMQLFKGLMRLLLDKGIKNEQSSIENPKTAALYSFLAGNDSTKIESSKVRFNKIYATLFPHDTNFENLDINNLRNAVSAPKLLLPFPKNEVWMSGGTHPDAGSFSGIFGVYSALDFYKGRAQTQFGHDHSNTWVTAATAGTVIRHSSCFAEVLGPNGFSTTYYHLDNIIVNTGESVSAGQRISNYATSLGQAICSGGNASTPHLHFSLKLNGEPMHLGGVELSGYRVIAGGVPYETQCNLFWLERNGVRYCAFTPIINSEGSSPPITVVPPDAPAKPSASDSLSNKVTVSWQEVSEATNYIVFVCTSSRVSSCDGGVSVLASTYDHITAKPGITYYYRVQACNSSGCSDYSPFDTGYRVLTFIFSIIQLLFD